MSERDDTKLIPLTQGQFALVDATDFDRFSRYKWYAKKSGAAWYAVRNKWQGGKRMLIYMHREILQTPPGMETDHKDGDGLNNRRYNLRAATRAQNHYNQEKRTRFSSRFKGVYWNRHKAKWRAQIRIAGKLLHLGYFLSETEAAKTYDEKASQLFGGYAKLNVA